MSRMGVTVVLASAEGAECGAGGWAETDSGMERRKLLMAANVVNFILSSTFI